ncbi:MAG: hypothetical protein WCP55_06665 [Lentisphaerota bacterium]
MKTHVAMLMKGASVKEQKQVTASVSLTTPIVREAQVVEQKEEPSLTEKLSNMFTVAGPKNDRFIKMDIAERTRENQSR